MTYEQYLCSPEWAQHRSAALERADHRCQICNGDYALHVHHRTYARLGHERPADLTVLCGHCHRLFHGRLTEHDRYEQRRKEAIRDLELMANQAREDTS